MTWMSCPKIDKFLYFIIPLSLNVPLFQRVLIWLQLKQVLLECFLRKHRDGSMTIATSKMKLFVALLSSFQLLTNFTKNPNVGATGVLNGSSRILQGILKFVLVIKLILQSIACNFSKDNLFHWLMNYSNSSGNCIFISYPIS